MKNAKTGILLSSISGIVFIILKIVGAINWSWVWVLAPIWLPPALILVVLVMGALFIWLLDKG